MPLRLFAARPPLDEPSIEWIFSVFDWALRHLDAGIFYQETELIVPSNDHFPGRASSRAELAELMFRHTLRHAGMAHWPIGLSHPGDKPLAGLLATEPTPLRRARRPQIDTEPTQAGILVGYDPQLTRNPEAMIAGFAQVLAHHLGSAVPAPPPGGIPNWPQTTEVLGVFLGFGLLFANTASTFRTSGCGSCGGAPAQREVYLSQYDITYALALFCTLKGITNAAVLPQLKRSLRGHFRRSRRDIKRRGSRLVDLSPNDTPVRAAAAARGVTGD